MNEFSGIDFEGVDLGGIDLAGIDDSPLNGVDLSGVDLEGIDLDGIDLVGEGDRGFFGNTLRGAGERAADLGGNLLEFVGNVAKSGERYLAEETGVNPGIRFGPDGISFEMNLSTEETGNPLASAGQALSEAGQQAADYKPQFTWERLKGDISPSNLAGYIVEQGVKSVPDMAAALATLPAYIASRTEEIAEVRAENKGKEQVDLQEIKEAVVPAVAASLLERIGAKGVTATGAAVGAKGVAKEVSKAASKEGATEFIQENIEYAGETVGTNVDYDAAEGFDRGVAGLVAGAGMGGSVRGATATVEALRQIESPIAEQDIPETNDRGPLIIDELPEMDASQTQGNTLAQGADLNQFADVDFTGAIPSVPVEDEVAALENIVAQDQAVKAAEIDAGYDQAKGVIEARKRAEQEVAWRSREKQTSVPAAVQPDEVIAAVDNAGKPLPYLAKKLEGKADAARQRILEKRKPANPAMAQAMQGALSEAGTDAKAVGEKGFGDKLTRLSVEQSRHLKPALKRPDKNRILSERDELMTAIRKLGGYNMDAARADGIDPAHFNDKVGRNNPFRKDGRSLDDLAESLQQYGYQTPNANSLLEQISQSMAGTPVYTPEGAVSRVQEQEREDLALRALDEADKTPVESALDSEGGYPSDTSVQENILGDLVNTALDAGVTQGAIDAILNNTADTPFQIAGRLLAETQKERNNDQDSTGSSEGGGVESSYPSRDEEVPGFEQQYSEQGNQTPGNDSLEVFFGLDREADSLLSSYTETELAQQDAKLKVRQEADAKAKADDDRKIDADTQLNDFNLIGSNASADVAVARGQNDMFEAKKSEIDAAAHEAATSPFNEKKLPSEGQKQAGNYKKGRVEVHGIKIAIENPKGSVRSGTDPDGNRWENKIYSHYGDIQRSEGADGDPVDVFVGEDLSSEKVYIIDQVNADGSFDEHKVMLAFANKAKAITGYKKNYDKGWKVGPVTVMSVEEFKAWLKTGDTTKPLSSRLLPVKKHNKQEGTGEPSSSTAQPDVRFSKSPVFSPDSVEADEYRRQLSKALKSLRSGLMPIKMGATPRVLQALGAPDLDLYIRRDTVRKATNGAKNDDHTVPLSVIEELPELLADPIAVLDSQSKKGDDPAKVVVVDAYSENGKPIVVAIHLSQKEGRLVVNRIASLYGRTGFGSMELRYLHKEKNPDLVRLMRPQWLGSGSPRRGLDQKILRPEDIVNRKSLAPQASNGMSAKGLKTFLKPLLGEFKAAKITVVETENELPRDVKTAAFSQAEAGEVKGLYHNGDIYIVAAAHSNPRAAARTVLHEAVGHLGLRQLLGSDFNPVLKQVYESAPEHKLQAIADLYELDLSTEEGRLEAADEYLAKTSEADFKPNLMLRIVAAVRRWLRQVMPSIKWSKADILALIHRSRRNLVMQGKIQGLKDQVVMDGIRKNVKAKKVVEQESAWETADRAYTPEQISALRRGGFGKFKTQKSFKDAVHTGLHRAKTKIRQGMFDQYASFREVLGDNRAWMMANLSASAPGVVEAVIEHGRPYLKDGAVGINTRAKGLKDTLAPLGEELDDWLSWMAGNRAARLKQEGRENLFSEADIEALKSLSMGKMANGKSRVSVYQQVKKDFESLHNSITEIAVQTGLIGKEEQELWVEQGFYVPFYRQFEEDTKPRGAGALGKGGLVRQNAYKELKGGTSQLDDLLSNVLLNWNHLISASLKNQAAAKAMAPALEMGIANPSRSGAKNAFFVRINGDEQWYQLDDSQDGALVLDSLLALNWNGLNTKPVKVMRWFKRALTTGVTVSPLFRIRNLMRDSLTAVAVAAMGTNVGKNVTQGWKATSKKSDIFANMIAGGGAFGASGYIHGADPDAIRKLVDKGVKRDTILDTRLSLHKLWNAYEDFGSRMENVNRAANFEQALEGGKDLLEANFEARDHLDFSRTGSWTAVRFLAQTVPFLGARLQGLDKLGRAAMSKEQRGQFATVVGMYTLASIALYLAVKDDEDYKRAEQWERDAYHLIPIPGSDTFFRLPRPFEVGAIGAMGERIAEQMVDDEVNGELFAERLSHALLETFSMDPMPQMFKPMVEVYSNKDSFTGRSIESMAMKRLSPELRKRERTSETAVAASEYMGMAFPEKAVLSPVQIEHLVRGYFGWLGATSLAVVDSIATRPLSDAPSKPAKRWTQYPVIKGFFRSGEPYGTQYTETFYRRLKEIEQANADIRFHQKRKELNEAKDIRTKERRKLRSRKAFNQASKTIRGLRGEIDKVLRSETINPEQKRIRTEMLRARINQIQETVVRRTNKDWR